MSASDTSAAASRCSALSASAAASSLPAPRPTSRTPSHLRQQLNNRRAPEVVRLGGEHLSRLEPFPTPFIMTHEATRERGRSGAGSLSNKSTHGFDPAVSSSGMWTSRVHAEAVTAGRRRVGAQHPNVRACSSDSRSDTRPSHNETGRRSSNYATTTPTSGGRQRWLAASPRRRQGASRTSKDTGPEASLGAAAAPEVRPFVPPEADYAGAAAGNPASLVGAGPALAALAAPHLGVNPGAPFNMPPPRTEPPAPAPQHAVRGKRKRGDDQYCTGCGRARKGHSRSGTTAWGPNCRRPCKCGRTRTTHPRGPWGAAFMLAMLPPAGAGGGGAAGAGGEGVVVRASSERG